MVPKMGRRIKLSVIGPRGFPGVQGGIERFSEGVYPRLVKLGYDVTCFTLGRVTLLSEWRGVKFVKIVAPSVKALEKLYYSLIASIYILFKRPDIVHVHSITSGSFIFLLRLFRIKILARYNSQDYMHDKWGPIARLVLRNAEEQFLKANFIVANNKDYIHYLESRGRVRGISYLPNGVDIVDQKIALDHFDKRFSNELTKNKFILYVGRITKEKNIITLIKAYAELKLHEINLVIVGNSAHADDYMSDLKNYSRKGSIHFMGELSRSDLDAMYSACKLFVMPSLYEGMPNVLLEAMSFNCNILVSRITAHLQFELHDSDYFDPLDTEDLKNKMREKFANESSNDYTDKIADYSWDSVTEKLNEIHKQILIHENFRFF